MAKTTSLTLLKLGSSFLFFLVGFLWDGKILPFSDSSI